MKSFVPPSAKYPLKDRISISFSGGKTSAYMTKMLLDHFRANEPDREIIVTFANTGQEHEETLKFVERCDKAFGFDLVWLEAVVDPRKGKGIRHRVVNFETASRLGEPFEEYIKKHGDTHGMNFHQGKQGAHIDLNIEMYHLLKTLEIIGQNA